MEHNSAYGVIYGLDFGAFTGYGGIQQDKSTREINMFVQYNACIDRHFLVSGWAVEVVGIVQYCGLITAGILFFTDLEKQKQNMFPLLFLIFFSLISSVIGLTFYKEEGRWALEVMGAIALVLLIACIAVLNSYLIRELKKRFHTK